VHSIDNEPLLHSMVLRLVPASKFGHRLPVASVVVTTLATEEFINQLTESLSRHRSELPKTPLPVLVRSEKVSSAAPPRPEVRRPPRDAGWCNGAFTPS
jgi:hypothetical protein